MARIRTIKPEFPQSESMGNISRDARLTFILLWTLADDEGRLRGNSRMLASLLFPYDDGEDGHVRTSGSDVERWLRELEHEGCIVRYEIDGAAYLQVCKWLNHQKIDKPSKSKIPQFDESSRILSNPLEKSSEDQGSRKGKDQGKGKDLNMSPADADDDDRGDPVKTIFEYWQKVMRSPRSALDKKRHKLITDAMKHYSPTDICIAIRGCSKSPFHMGDNGRGRKYNGLHLILRSAEYIDQFIELDSGTAARAAETDAEREARIIAEFCGEYPDDDERTIDMENPDGDD